MRSARFWSESSRKLRFETSKKSFENSYMNWSVRATYGVSRSFTNRLLNLRIVMPGMRLTSKIVTW